MSLLPSQMCPLHLGHPCIHTTRSSYLRRDNALQPQAKSEAEMHQVWPTTANARWLGRPRSLPGCQSMYATMVWFWEAATRSRTGERFGIPTTITQDREGTMWYLWR